MSHQFTEFTYIQEKPNMNQTDNVKRIPVMMDLYWKHKTDVNIKYGEKAIVFIQNGTFYESYHMEKTEITKHVSRVLNNVVSLRNNSRPVSNTNPYQLGFPTISIQKNLEVLVSHGYTIVLMDQVWDADHVKVIDRVLTRIITPGTFFEHPPSDSNHNICCIQSVTKNIHYVCFVDVSIGEVQTMIITQFDEFLWFMNIHNPIEIVWLVESSYPHTEEFEKYFCGRSVFKKITSDYKFYFDNAYQQATFKKVYQYTSVYENIPSTVLACIVCLYDFMWTCNSKIVNSLSIPKMYMETHLTFYNDAMNQLDLLDSKKGKGVLSIIDKTCTAMGKRLLKNQLLNPFCVKKDIDDMYWKTNAMFDNDAYAQYMNVFQTIPDLDRICRCIELDYAVLLNIEKLQNPIENVLTLGSEIVPNYELLSASIAFINERINFSKKTLKSGFDSKFDEYESKYNVMYTSLNRIVDEIPLKRNTKNGTYSLCKIEKNDNGFYVCTGSKKLNLSEYTVLSIGKNQSRIESKQINEICKLLTSIEEQMKSYSENYLKEIIDEYKTKYIEIVKLLSKWIANNDTICSRCMLKVDMGYTLPKCNDTESSGTIHGVNVKHPIVHQYLPYVGNDVQLDKNKRGLLLYGLNGSGKSTYGKAVALNLVLAQSGFYVCADHFEFTPFSKMFARINCDDNIFEGKSSFKMEMEELQTVLNFADNKSLLIGDELCKGTEHSSAVGLVVGTSKKLLEKEVKFVFASHLHDVPELLQKYNQTIYSYLQIKHLESYIDGNSIVYSRILKDGKGNSHYGIEVADALLKDSSLIYDANIIRNMLLDNYNHIVNPKKSVYNAKMYKDVCERCGDNAIDIHHIVFQNEFKNIKNNKKMNAITNLTSLCKQCHIMIHNGSLRITQQSTPIGIINKFTLVYE